MAKYFQYTLTHATDPSSPLVLTHSPAGWDKKSITFFYHKTYKSVFRSASLDLRFVKEGKEFIDTIFDSEGIEAEIGISIYIQNPVSLLYNIAFYTGILDLSKREWDVDFTSCPIIDGSKEAAFIGNDELEFDLNSLVAYDNTTVVAFLYQPETLNLPALDLYRYAKTQAVKQVIDEAIQATENVTTYAQNTTTLINDLGDNLLENDNKIYENKSAASIDVNIVYDWSLVGTVIFSARVGLPLLVDYTLKAIHKNSVGAVQNTMTLATLAEVGAAGGNTVNVSESGSQDVTYTFAVGDYLEYEIDYTMGDWEAGETIEIDLLNTFNPHTIIEEITTPPATTCRIFMAYEAVSRMVQLMTGETNTSKLIYSEILGRTDSEFQTYASDGDASLLAITNGINIRKLTRAINCKFKDLWLSIANMYDLGLWYNRTSEYFEIKERSEFRDTSRVIIDLGEVKEMRITVAEDYVFNKILTGQVGKGEYEELNGVDEINLPAEYSTIITKIKNTLDIRIPYRTDSVGIEYQRRKKLSADDAKYDDTNFIIQCVRDGGNYAPELGSAVSATSDDIINVENYYNMRHTPKALIKTNKARVAPPFWKSLTSLLQFRKNQFDNDVSTTENYLSENNPLVSYFLFPSEIAPIYYNFNSPLTAAHIAILNSDPHGLISGTYLDEDGNQAEFEGFIERASTEPYESQGNWKLIKKYG